MRFPAFVTKKTICPLLFLAALLVVASCTTTSNKTKYYKLQTISDTPLKTKDEVTAYVQLRNTGSNFVTIFTVEKGYQLFRVYRQERGQGDFKTLGTLRAGTAENFTQSEDDTDKRLIFFEDTGHSSINDRYRITPIVDGAELAPLKIVYDTDDPDYFRKIEGREPNRQDQRPANRSVARPRFGTAQ